uniref:Uncharacterized protein n=1 Tax=Mycena chlorophos TaxID=658473 RepID=A0ABQ0LWD1_MYCCL|nr:predicted protein [Mycena chlorophos]
MKIFCFKLCHGPICKEPKFYSLEVAVGFEPRLNPAGEIKFRPSAAHRRVYESLLVSYSHREYRHLQDRFASAQDPSPSPPFHEAGTPNPAARRLALQDSVDNGPRRPLSEPEPRQPVYASLTRMHGSLSAYIPPPHASDILIFVNKVA